MPRNHVNNSIPSETRIPSYRLHRRSGQGVVTLSGRDIDLGAIGSPESKERYQSEVSKWLANGGRLMPESPVAGLSVNQVLARYREHAEAYYMGVDGKPDARTMWHIKRAIRAVRELFGMSQAAEFGPRALAVVQNHLVTGGFCRKSVNKYIGFIKRAFRWAASQELVPASVWQGLASLEGLRRGRTKAAEPAPIGPVSDKDVDAVQLCLPRQVWGLVQLMRYCGCRPGEAVGIRGIDIDVSGPVWLWRPPTHKNAWRGHVRTISLGPQAQAVVKDFWKADLQAFLFSPADADAEIRQARTAARVTPVNQGNRPGSNRRRQPKRKPKDCYTVSSLDRAIARACDKAGIPGWSANRLRHSFATKVRKQWGIDAAGVALGHAHAAVTEIYAERNMEQAVKIAAAIG